MKLLFSTLEKMYNQPLVQKLVQLILWKQEIPWLLDVERNMSIKRMIVKVFWKLLLIDYG